MLRSSWPLLLCACSVLPRADVPPPPEADACTPRYHADPWRPPTRDVAPIALGQGARWTHDVNAIGAYGHEVAIDADGRVRWTHDTANRVFAMTTIAPDGTHEGTRRLDPVSMQPGVLAVGPDRAVVAGGTVYEGAHGPTLTAMEPTGDVRWKQGTPRISVDDVEALGDRWVMLGSSGRAAFTLGDVTHRKVVGEPGQSRDAVAVLDVEGHYAWSRSFLPGTLGMAVHGGEIYLAGHFGSGGWVDYGGGNVFATGVLAKLGADGEHRWSQPYDAGLYDVVPWGDDVLVSARSVEGGSMFHVVGPSGCDRGALDLGQAGRVRAGTDGSLVLYGLSTRGDPVRVGSTTFEVPALSYWIARLTPALELAWVRIADCDSVEAAAGPAGQTAVSCFRDLSMGDHLLRRTTLYGFDRPSN